MAFYWGYINVNKVTLIAFINPTFYIVPFLAMQFITQLKATLKLANSI